MNISDCLRHNAKHEQRSDNNFGHVWAKLGNSAKGIPRLSLQPLAPQIDVSADAVTLGRKNDDFVNGQSELSSY